MQIASTPPGRTSAGVVRDGIVFERPSLVSMLSTLSLEQITETRIRGGRHDDLPAIARLLERANHVDHLPRVAVEELEAVVDRAQLIVLELQPSEIAAAACVASGRGLMFLVIDPEVASPELEHRMIAVADAMCESQRDRKVRVACAR